MRNRWRLGALCCGALLLGISGGAAIGPTKVYADAERGDQKIPEPARAQGRASGAPAPRSSGVRCKLTKECQKISADMVCQRFGDHKECATTFFHVPVAHPNT
jgi:hypothetical protein